METISISEAEIYYDRSFLPDEARPRINMTFRHIEHQRTPTPEFADF